MLPRHAGVVRVTHWITTLCFFALLVSGIEIIISHPRFYWGEAGNVLMKPLFIIPIPASRGTVPTGYGYVLPDQNGWSRALHFQTAWLVVFTGLVYVIWGLFSRHFVRKMWPDLSWTAIAGCIKEHLRLNTDLGAYNVLQRLSYLGVIFILFPLEIWTGLAMSPAAVSVFPDAMSVFGGQQSARTIHFFVSGILLLFVVIHVVMVCVSGFRKRMRMMTIGGEDL